MSVVNVPFAKSGKRWETAPIVGKGGDIRVRVHKNHYLTAMFNYGRSGIDIKNFFRETRNSLVWGDLYDYNASNWWGAGIRYSIDTKVGPINFDISSSNISRKVNIYCGFGYYF